MSAMIYGNLAVNIVLASSLQFLWGMINALQIIVHIPLMSIQMPSNLLVFYQLLISVVTFDILPA